MARHLITLMGTQKIAESEKLRLEEAMIEAEVRAVMEKCLEAGDGDMAVGLCKGVEAGWVDTMLTPWKYNKGNVVVMRATRKTRCDISIREISLFRTRSRNTIGQNWRREKKEGRKLTFETVVKDLQFASILKKK